MLILQSTNNKWQIRHLFDFAKQKQQQKETHSHNVFPILTCVVATTTTKVGHWMSPVNVVASWSEAPGGDIIANIFRLLLDLSNTNNVRRRLSFRQQLFLVLSRFNGVHFLCRPPPPVCLPLELLHVCYAAAVPWLPTLPRPSAIRWNMEINRRA